MHLLTTTVAVRVEALCLIISAELFNICDVNFKASMYGNLRVAFADTQYDIWSTAVSNELKRGIPPCKIKKGEYGGTPPSGDGLFTSLTESGILACYFLTVTKIVLTIGNNSI